MAVANTKSTAITNADATQPRVQGQTWIQGALPWVAVGTAEVAAADDNDSVYRFLRVPSGARIHKLEIASDAITGGSDYNFGVYKPGGAIVSGSLFADALDMSIGNTVPVEITFAAVDLADAEKRLWELLGLSADPMVEYDICATGITVGTGAGTILLRAEWVI